MIDEKRLADYLPQQRWYGAKDRRIERVDVLDRTVLRDKWPMLIRLLVGVRAGGTTDEYHLLVGVREAGERTEFLGGNDQAVFGEVDTDEGPGFAYEATLDPELALQLLRMIAPDEEARIVRVMAAEQSNTSIVYDDRLILKVYRRLEAGPNPDVDVTTRLAELGFAHVPRPVAAWREHDRDLAFVQQYLVGGSEGWSLALTSLRDVFGLHDTTQVPVIRLDQPMPEITPSSAGGDFAAEAERLGSVTAALHATLAEAFGRHPADPKEWVEVMQAELADTPHGSLDTERITSVFERVLDCEDVGPAIRIHGDLHLGQVMRTDTGWYVLDFEGEPARPLERRIRPTSPLRDVAGMLRSFHYASQVALRERGAELDEAVVTTAAAWERRNRDAFLDGYLPVAEEAGLLPVDASARAAVLAAFELDKAIYELRYELSHRPDWAGIPLQAVHRMLEGA